MNDHPVTILNKAFTSAIPWTYFTILHLSRLDVEGVDSQRTPSSRSTQNMIQSPSRSNFALAYGLTCFGTMLGSGRISTLRIGGPHGSTRLWHNIKSSAILQTMAPRWHSHLQQQLIVSSSYKYQRPVGKEIMLGRPKMERRRLSVNLSRKQPQDHRSSWGLTETMWCSLICIIDEASPPLREIQPMKLICVAWLTYLNLEDMSFTLILNSTLILFSGLPWFAPSLLISPLGWAILVTAQYRTGPLVVDYLTKWTGAAGCMPCALRHVECFLRNASASIQSSHRQRRFWRKFRRPSLKDFKVGVDLDTLITLVEGWMVKRWLQRDVATWREEHVQVCAETDHSPTWVDIAPLAPCKCRNPTGASMYRFWAGNLHCHGQPRWIDHIVEICERFTDI